MAELRHERRVLRVNFALTALTLIGLVVGIVAVARAGAGVGETGAGGFLENFVGAGGRAGLVAAIGYAVAYLAGGLPAFWSALKALFLRGKLAIDMLMVLAAIAAALVGEVRDGAILLFLFSLAETLEEYAMGNTKRAVAALMQLKPDTATLMENGDHRVVSVDEVDIGARILVRPGERIPLDGTMVAGSSAVDQAPITGESVPVDKVVGDPVFAGTVNGYGAIEVEVTKDASHSTLARMIDLVTIAQSQRSPSQRFSEWFGQRYTRFVLLGAAAALGGFLLFGLPRDEAFYRAATLLVVASPCAIVISVPAAVLSALARAARIGVLFKGGAALEDLGSLDIVAFDKTGTLPRRRHREHLGAPRRQGHRGGRHRRRRRHAGHRRAGRSRQGDPRQHRWRAALGRNAQTRRRPRRDRVARGRSGLEQPRGRGAHRRAGGESRHRGRGGGGRHAQAHRGRDRRGPSQGRRAADRDAHR